MEMSKVYGYCRVAFADEEEMTKRIEIVNNYCKTHNLSIDKHFFDNGVSGLELNRKGLNALIDVLRGGDIVVAYNMASLSRSMFDRITLINLIDSIGAKLIITN